MNQSRVAKLQACLQGRGDPIRAGTRKPDRPFAPFPLYPLIADMGSCPRHVCLVPETDTRFTPSNSHNQNSYVQR
jgi:hypothetical protein